MRRKTRECEIEIKRSNKIKVETPSPFFTHVIQTFLFYMGLKLKVSVKTFDNIPHHYIEDTGLLFGEFLKKEMKDFKGIRRFSWCAIPMDESWVLISIDISNRSGFHLHGMKRIEYMNFFEGFSKGMKITVHLKPLSIGSYHHFIEACFKGFSICLKEAIKRENRRYRSTKGIL